MAEVENLKHSVLNFFASAFLGIMGFALLPEVINENDVPDKIDDALFFLLGLFAIFWYRKNSSKRSAMPIVLLAIAVLIKIGAIIIEHDDKEAVGDDIGVFIGIVIALGVAVTKYKKS